MLLTVGVFAEVYLVDNEIIRKMPCSESQDDRLPIVQEARVYTILGVHPRIAELKGRVDYVDIRYYPHGDLAHYCQRNYVDPELQSIRFLQILEAVVFVHSRHVIHSDLSLRQFFIDDDLNLRLGDFNASQYPGSAALGYEKTSHCLPRDYEQPNTEASDIFALGSTLYELVAGKAPYSELSGPKSDDPELMKAQIQRQPQVDYEIESRYKNGIFPDVSGLFGGDVILGCWRGEFTHAKGALDFYLNEQYLNNFL